MINDKMILGAMKLCIGKLDHITDDIKYLYEVNQVLNRFKYNIIKLIDGDEMSVLPAEAVQFVITTAIDIAENCGVQEVTKTYPSMLRMTWKDGMTQYGDDTFIEHCSAVDISSVFRNEAFNGIDPGFLKARRNKAGSTKKHPVIARVESAFEEHPDALFSFCSIFIEIDRPERGLGYMSAAIGSLITPDKFEKLDMKRASRHSGYERGCRNTKKDAKRGGCEI